MATRFRLTLLLLIAFLAAAQTTAPPPPASTTPTPYGVAFVRENYSKYEYRVPMRDGVKLFTAVYIPKDVLSEGKTYPILLERTPYSVAPYGVDQYPAAVGPSEQFAREKFIFAYQDVRGRYMSEGDFTIARPLKKPDEKPQEADESTDAYDTIDWLLKNIGGNTGKVGVWGISQPGFFATAAMVHAHPALLAVSPQAPVTDYYLGDDIYHNGAFMLAARFGMYTGFKPRGEEPEAPTPQLPFDYKTPDGYDFYLSLGTLANADERFFKHTQPYWTMNVNNNTYNDFWQARSIWKHLSDVKPAVMLVGGWYDAEDPQGLFRQYDFMAQHSPATTQMLVVGPWTHGGFSRGDGDRVGNISFGEKTAVYYREKIEFPFFLYYLKGRGEAKMPRAWVFETGVNQWRKFDAWPPAKATAQHLYLDSKGKTSWTQEPSQSFLEYVSDPAKPVPYIGHVLMGMRYDYMTEDQRFASTRPDVLVFKSEPLDHDITIAGPLTVDLKVSTTGTDSDFDLKLIDVLPGDYPDYMTVPAAAPGVPGMSRAQPANAIQLGDYQELIRGEPFRGKFRNGFQTPVAFTPGKPERITFQMPDILHTFRTGHRIMVQVQSSWFPLTDRNPQKFVNITNALTTDFVKATERVFVGGADGSKISFLTLQPALNR